MAPAQNARIHVEDLCAAHRSSTRIIAFFKHDEHGHYETGQQDNNTFHALQLHQFLFGGPGRHGVLKIALGASTSLALARAIRASTGARTSTT